MRTLSKAQRYRKLALKETNKAMIDQCGEYLDWIRVSPEDLASEKTAFQSLAMFNTQLKPHYMRAIQATKEYYLRKNPNGKIQFHTCGPSGVCASVSFTSTRW